MQSQREKLTSLALVSINFALQTYIKKLLLLQRTTNVLRETLDDCEFEIGSIKDSCYLRESSSIAVKSFALLLLLCWDCMRLVVEAEEQLLLSNVVKMLIRGLLDFLKRRKRHNKFRK